MWITVLLVVVAFVVGYRVGMWNRNRKNVRVDFTVGPVIRK